MIRMFDHVDVWLHAYWGFITTPIALLAASPLPRLLETASNLWQAAEKAAPVLARVRQAISRKLSPLLGALRPSARKEQVVFNPIQAIADAERFVQKAQVIIPIAQKAWQVFFSVESKDAAAVEADVKEAAAALPWPAVAKFIEQDGVANGIAQGLIALDQLAEKAIADAAEKASQDKATQDAAGSQPLAEIGQSTDGQVVETTPAAQ